MCYLLALEVNVRHGWDEGCQVHKPPVVALDESICIRGIHKEHQAFRIYEAELRWWPENPNIHATAVTVVACWFRDHATAGRAFRPDGHAFAQSPLT